MRYGRFIVKLRFAVAACLAVVAVLALAACGSSGKSSSSSSASSGGGSSSGGSSSGASSAGGSSSGINTSGGKSVHLSIIVADSTENAFQEMEYGGQAAAQHITGVQLNSAAPPTASGSAEVQLFQSAQQTSKDGIALMTTTPPDFVRPFSQAVSAGIPVVAVDAPGLPGSNVNTFVGNSNTQLGAALAKVMLKKIPAGTKGQVILGDPIPGLPLLAARIKGFQTALKAARPNLTFVGPVNVNNDPTGNYDHWNALVQKYPNAVAYMDPGDQGAVSFAKIEQATGKKYLTGGCDVNPEALAAVKNGYVYSLIDPRHFLKGYIAISMLAAHAQHGQALPKGWFNPGFGIVTKANVNQIIAREQSNSTRYAYYAPIVKQELADPSKYMKPLSEAN